MKRRHTLAFVLASVLAAPLAAADDLPPPPANCPVGSFGKSNHSGEWCQPSTCKTDDDCKAVDDRWPRNRKNGPYVCRDQPLCVLHTTVPPGGHGGRRNPDARIDREVAQSDCSKPCSGGAQCERARRCMLGTGAQSDGSASPDGSTPIGSASPVDVAFADGGTSATTTPRPKGCGCGVPPGTTSLGAGLSVLVSALAMFRRRRHAP